MEIRHMPMHRLWPQEGAPQRQTNTFYRQFRKIASFVRLLFGVEDCVCIRCDSAHSYEYRNPTCDVCGEYKEKRSTKRLEKSECLKSIFLPEIHIPHTWFGLIDRVYASWGGMWWGRGPTQSERFCPIHPLTNTQTHFGHARSMYLYSICGVLCKHRFPFDNKPFTDGIAS